VNAQEVLTAEQHDTAVQVRLLPAPRSVAPTTDIENTDLSIPVAPKKSFVGTGFLLRSSLNTTVAFDTPTTSAPASAPTPLAHASAPTQLASVGQLLPSIGTALSNTSLEQTVPLAAAPIPGPVALASFDKAALIQTPAVTDSQVQRSSTNASAVLVPSATAQNVTLDPAATAQNGMQSTQTRQATGTPGQPPAFLPPTPVPNPSAAYPAQPASPNYPSLECVGN
jgi:hypothetical protein